MSNTLTCLSVLVVKNVKRTFKSGEKTLKNVKNSRFLGFFDNFQRFSNIPVAFFTTMAITQWPEDMFVTDHPNLFLQTSY